MKKLSCCGECAFLQEAAIMYILAEFHFVTGLFDILQASLLPSIVGGLVRTYEPRLRALTKLPNTGTHHPVEMPIMIQPGGTQ